MEKTKDGKNEDKIIETGVGEMNFLQNTTVKTEEKVEECKERYQAPTLTMCHLKSSDIILLSITETFGDFMTAPW